ncbi:MULTISPECIES: hypothetical protein [Salinimonas]|uniref:Uncharacterized protein n=2 Tax=Salinimonas TaxID=288793 RepID=A0A5B7YIX5_9ALTE|nr:MULTISPECIES: hypothetical protein [Salinimonas]MBD3587214.1 hypothetical protein [Salinimonas profundi]QCZ95320.1 hypothetical protein FBQ74_17380 [Salinimonas iocasae]
MRKHLKMKVALLLMTAGFNTVVWADDPAKVVAEGYDKLYENGEITANKLLDLKASALNYYSENGAWPTDITDLAVDGFYYGSYDTMYGTTVSGVEDGNSYILSVDVLKDSVANYVASFMNGTTTDSTVNVQFGLPSQVPVLHSTLSRVDDGDVARNTMETDLHMGGYSITDIDTVTARALVAQRADIQNGYIENIYAQLINAPLANLTTVNSTTVNSDVVNSDRIYASVGVYDNGTRVFSPANLPTKADVGLSNVQNYGATNSYTGNSTTLYATQSAVYNSHVYLKNLKLDKNATAVNADRLDNLDSSSFIRSNAYDAVNANTRWEDNREIRLGSSSDMRLKHDGSNSIIDNYTGNLYLRNLSGGREIYLQGTTSGGQRHTAVMVDSSSYVRARLMYNGSSKLYTESNGVRVSGDMNVTSGDLKVNGQKISKDYVDLGRVMNFSISDSYTGGSSNVYASQRAVTRAYNALNSSKLGKKEKAADSDKLDGIDSSGFVRTSRRINGKSLTSNITITKSDVGLSNVRNYGATNSYTGASTQRYVTQKALNDAYHAAVRGGTKDYRVLYSNISGLNSGDFYLNSSWRGYDEILVLGGNDKKSSIYMFKFTEQEYDLAYDLWRSGGGRLSDFRFQMVKDANYYWNGHFASNTHFSTQHENSVLYQVFGLTYK